MNNPFLTFLTVMLFCFPALISAAAAASFLGPAPQSLFSNPPPEDITPNSYRIPTVHESAIQARRILHIESIGTLSTIFPSKPTTSENRPENVAGNPIGLMEYFGDCEPSTGNPTILAITIATSFKNVAAGSNITLSMRWHPPFSHGKRWSEASLPRFSLVGYLEEIDDNDVKKNLVPACFVKYHPDAAWWLPGNKIHESRWVRLVVQEIYWIGGFGDRAYIGWIPLEEWKSVTEEEISKCRLPGEGGSTESYDWPMEL